jgi:hypothetical protein
LSKEARSKPSHAGATIDGIEAQPVRQVRELT